MPHVLLPSLAVRGTKVGQGRRGPDSGEFPCAFSPDGEQRLQFPPEVTASPSEPVGGPWGARGEATVWEQKSGEK